MACHAARRRAVALLIATLVLSGTAGCAVDNPFDTSGPVSFDGAEVEATSGVRADAGAQVVFGQATVRNDGDDPATLTAGVLDGAIADTQAQVVEVRVIDLDADQGDLVGAAVWPFEDYRARSVPLRGFELAAGGEAELLYIVEVIKTGTWAWPRSVLKYSVDGTNYTTSTSLGFEVCPMDPAAKC